MVKYLKEIEKIAEEMKMPIYLVGGFVRDSLLKSPSEDVDFLVLGNSSIFARKTAEKLAGTFIVLDSLRCVYRVVLKNSNNMISLDFSGVEKNGMVENLVNRDFKINSLAVSLKDYLSSTELSKDDIIDYIGGINDIEGKKISANQMESFKKDPLRMLRAFRLSAVYNFDIEGYTLELIEKNAHLIKEVSGERIRDELFKIIKCNNSFSYINLMWEIGLLKEIFPEIIELNNTEQNGYHSSNVWIHCLQAMASFENKKWTEVSGIYMNRIEDYLKEEITIGRSKLDLLKFALLFHDCGKPATKGIKEDGRITFYGHDEAGVKEIRKICDRLILSNQEKQFISHIIRYHMGPLTLFTLKNKSQMAIRKFFRKTQPEALGILLHAFADKNASRGSLQKKEDLIKLKYMIKELIEEYFTHSLYQKYQPVLSGRDLIVNFNLAPGPQIGRILAMLDELYIKEGLVTKDKALILCKDMILKNSMPTT